MTNRTPDDYRREAERLVIEFLAAEVETNLAESVLTDSVYEMRVKWAKAHAALAQVNLQFYRNYAEALEQSDVSLMDENFDELERGLEDAEMAVEELRSASGAVLSARENYVEKYTAEQEIRRRAEAAYIQ